MFSYIQTQRTAGTSSLFLRVQDSFLLVTTTRVITTVDDRSWYLVTGMHNTPVLPPPTKNLAGYLSSQSVMS